MTNQTQLLKEESQRAYYARSSESVELGYHRLDKEWSIQAVLTLMVIALMLWMFSYVLVMVIMFLYGDRNQTLLTFDFFYWINETCIDEKKFDKYALLY